MVNQNQGLGAVEMLKTGFPPGVGTQLKELIKMQLPT